MPTCVYDNVVDTAVRFAPLMHRCVALRRRALGLDSVHYYDLNVPLSVEPLTDIPYEEACDLAVRALEPLGPDYVANLKRGCYRFFKVRILGSV